MNILILNWRNIKDPMAGGAEQSLFEHARYWQKKGAKITWFSSAFKDCVKDEEVSGIRFICEGSVYSVHCLSFWNFIRGRFGQPDIIIDNFHGISFFTPMFIKKTRIISLIHEVAGKVWFENSHFPISVIGYLLERISFLLYLRIPFITVSKSCRDELVRLGLPEKNIKIIHNGISRQRVKKSIKRERNITILFLGRLSYDKGIKESLEAYSIAARKIPKLKLWIAGREEKSGQLKELINKVIKDDLLKSKIKYHGFVSDKKKFELYRRTWLLIHPSHKEGWGLTVIEAATQSTPTVGYDVEGLRDSIINGKTGLLSKPDPKSLAETIIALINNKKQYTLISRQARKHSEKFSWDKAGQESFSLIKKIYERKI